MLDALLLIPFALLAFCIHRVHDTWLCLTFLALSALLAAYPKLSKKPKKVQLPHARYEQVKNGDDSAKDESASLHKEAVVPREQLEGNKRRQKSCERPLDLDTAINKRNKYHPPTFYGTFDPSKQIRLLRVIPPHSDNHVPGPRCHFLKPCSFESKAFWKRTKYRALSYVWGPASEREDICLVFVHDKLVYVRGNFCDFCNAMYHEHNEGPFWIDALCIDQLNDQEKASQIRLMPKIYEEASLVYVRLGLCSTFAARGLTYIRDNGRELRNGGYKKMMTTLDETRLDDIISGSKAILRNSYWKRLWIVQEVMKARKPQIKTASDDGQGLSWEFTWLQYLQAIYEACGLLRGRMSMPSNFMTIVEEKIKKKRTGYELHDVLFRWSEQECRETHDKIYGLLGLVHKCEIQVDLSKRAIDLFQETLYFERERIHARGYDYSESFALKLMNAPERSL